MFGMFKYIPILLVMSFATQAQTITWLGANFEPAHYMEGPYAGQGYFDLMYQDIVQTLPEYKHVREPTSLTRFKFLLNDKRQFCSLDLLKTPSRAKHMLFSQPLVGMLPNGLITRKNDGRFSPYQQNGEIDLALLLQQNIMALAAMKERAYGGDIDSLLASHTDSAAIWWTTLETQPTNVIINGRVDFTIGFPTELYDSPEKVSKPSELAYTPIKDMPKLVFARASCSKSDNAQAIIDKVNLFLTEKPFDYFVPHYARWLPPGAQVYYLNLVKNQKSW